MKYNVTAVIVTCNRKKLLKLSIESLLKQTYSLHKIVIVNNASTDGTKEYLDSLDEEKIHVIHKEINEGGAGGFYYGVKEAYEQGCDFIWIMDDDTIATDNSLEELLNGYERVIDKPVGFLASNVMFKDDKPCFMNICNPDYVWNEFADEGIVRVTHCSFVAMLIPSQVIKTVGYPIKEYFIWGDDGEYSTRILRKYEGYVCGKSKVYHYMNENQGVDIWNIDEGRIDRFFYFYRNWMCTHRMRNKDDAKRFKKETKKLIRAIRKSNTKNKDKKIKIIKEGIKAGEKFDITIKYPERNVEEEFTMNFVPTRGIKYRLFRIFRYFAVKYDIKTQGHITYLKQLYMKYLAISPSKKEKFDFLVKGTFRTNLYGGEKIAALNQLLSETVLDFCKSDYFAYSFDVYKTWRIKDRQMANCAINYELLLNNSLHDLLMSNDNEYAKENNRIVNVLMEYTTRLYKEVGKSNLKNKKNIQKWIKNISIQPAESLEEALQRILFMNQIMWQTKHIQMGLGRLDLLLEKYITDDVSEEYIETLLADLFTLLHNYYWYKSEEMPGDTGQVIILGGMRPEGGEVCNKITYAAIKAIKRLQLPDPKILLRVTKDTPDDLWRETVECIATGIGCPLISNDERIVPEIVEFGYEEYDAKNYVTSACWEIIPGGSCEQNNIGVFDFAAAFDLMNKKDNLEALDTWDKFIWQFSVQLCGHVNYMAHLTDDIVWEKDPLMSFFNESCRTKYCDISEGGGKYNNYGILSVALSNTINSLINIRKYVYQEKRFTLKELFTWKNQNFVGKEDVKELLKNNKKYFGGDDEKEDAIGLANWLIMRVNETLADFENMYGGKVKFGLSSPGYITVGKNMPATFDGRLDGEAYNIHISADDNQNLTALFNFASSLIYGKVGFNGNVIDFTMNPQFVNDNMNKFITLLKSSIESGVFQMQMNVIDSKTLMDAKQNPNKFPNLIVRVWGFSAYFKDLPEEYKDYVIERAIKNEATRY